MLYTLRHLPECYPRPKSLKFSRWIIALVAMLSVSVILMRIFWRYVENLYFWKVALGVPIVLWSVPFASCLLLWALQDSKANAFDTQREQWILRETRKARRALQVLNVTFITGHSSVAQKDTAIAMQNNDSIIVSQVDRDGNESSRMSQIYSSPQDSLKFVITNIFSKLIAGIPFAHIPDKLPLVVFFDVTTSLPLESIRHYWDETWQKNNITLPIEYCEGTGLSVIDRWLNERIKDKAMLLIVGLQLKPAKSDNTAEAGVALLLGNRLTQESLEPLALLHRPDAAPTCELREGMNMAAYNVPLKENIVKNLWLAGLTGEQRAEVIECQNAHPAQSVEDEAVISLDTSMGHAGAAAPWLAIAAATEIARQTQSPQMIICGDTTQNVLWSTLITPIASRQEMDP
ncbi:Uncharacterised protein [Citrobacter braakii]|uniref:hypothetical protein n=1 Tax=Citrobacter braakii TaxID=57706 RepID=UPI000DFFEE08|nr:hypothetical protein [Citrobacter braakii]STH93570.1 Uncharacterised protein [Citrobacter braakii]HBE9116744.1 hypothetical protein [Citrobacter braakii]